MNFLRNILFFNVVVIIVFHALIPHKHHGEMTEEEHNMTHKNATGIIDIIGLAFHQGSSNNLDNYIISEQHSLNKVDFNGLVVFAGIFSIDFKLFPTNERPTTTIRPDIISNTYIINSNGLRAPPSFDSYS
ncbi:hypothetical protein [Mariniflexile sp. HMF6888]|uniref:hypothetical protein n=1 Tax=Mariniflexile sp. HMF6888 TaxID=3373086 RepID=UPI0037A5C1A3